MVVALDHADIDGVAEQHAQDLQQIISCTWRRRFGANDVHDV